MSYSCHLRTTRLFESWPIKGALRFQAAILWQTLNDVHRLNQSRQEIQGLCTVHGFAVYLKCEIWRDPDVFLGCKALVSSYVRMFGLAELQRSAKQKAYYNSYNILSSSFIFKHIATVWQCVALLAQRRPIDKDKCCFGRCIFNASFLTASAHHCGYGGNAVRQ